MSEFFSGQTFNVFFVFVLLVPLGDDDRCLKDLKCGEGEGDCDSNDDCKAGLVCIQSEDAKAGQRCIGPEYDSGDDCCERGKLIYLKCNFESPGTQLVAMATLVLRGVCGPFRENYKNRQFQHDINL